MISDMKRAQGKIWESQVTATASMMLICSQWDVGTLQTSRTPCSSVVKSKSIHKFFYKFMKWI
jgi:hypothetical protein